MDGLSAITSVYGKKVYFIGIKGTGMAALAELLHKQGAYVSGSDVADMFYTDAVLAALGIRFYQGFSADQVPSSAELVIYSAAYDPNSHPEIRTAYSMSIPVLSYHEALGFLSKKSWFCGISGVHGKTTTTAMVATILKETGLNVSVLVGSAVANLDNQSTLVKGTEFFVAETCEYKRHFLVFKPKSLLVTSIEPDHLDYYKDFNDIYTAFMQYVELISAGGTLIYCADDSGACALAEAVPARRPDIELIPYGTRAEGPFAITGIESMPGALRFSIAAITKPFTIHIPGVHSVLNATAALAVVTVLLRAKSRAHMEKPCGGRVDADSVHGGTSETGRVDADSVHGGTSEPGSVNADSRLSDELAVKNWIDEYLPAIEYALRSFKGSKRRSEIKGEVHGILFIDDYAHHPTAIQTTIKGLRQFYPHRRIVVDFMSHTYSRTKMLLAEFASCFQDADEIILHKIYASAREKDTGSIRGEDLFKAVKENHSNVRYFHEVLDAREYCLSSLTAGDLFVTMGAGDNWKLGRELFDTLSSSQQTTP